MVMSCGCRMPTTLPRHRELALHLAHPLADCLYLALAERLGVALITADRAFARRAARRSNLVQILDESGG